MSTAERCDECGSELRIFAGGLRVCPRCSVRLAIDETQVVPERAVRGDDAAGSSQPAHRPPPARAPSPPPDPGSARAASPEPDRVGRYRLLEAVGEGGMGTIYRALQTEPVRREVALKFVKWGMDTREVVARLEAERQALALMDHPAIARVFDGGATPEGRPYFVMEYVRGLPITEFCDQKRLTTTERLELFVQVCDGVQHAHQKGVIHRDLKPSNVLVAEQDGRPGPKVIDFGIAKAIGRGLTDDALHTRLDQRIGTPEYMSPEQAEPGGLDIDTRTDVYSLGVMLYELLAGTLPFADEDRGATRFDELLRRIRESEPPRPSTRATTLSRDAADLAHRRRTDPGGLRRQLQGDLDWIVMKAIEKDRNRRYGSPAELAADIRRHLADEPVVAGPPSTAYRVRKFVRRHRLAVVAAALVAVTALVAVAGITLGLVRARRAERLAEEEAAKATAINRFLQDVLGSADPYARLGRNVTVLEALDDSVQRIEAAFPDQPAIRAAVEDTIGTTYLELGRFAEAEPLLRQALETRRRVLAPDHPDLARSLVALARLLRARDNDLDAAEELQREALALRRRLHGGVHAEVADSLFDLAWIASDRGDYERSDELFAQALEMRRGLDPPRPLDVAEALHGAAGTRANRGDYPAAARLHREALELRRQLLGERHLLTAQSQSGLGLTLQAQGELEEAEGLLRAALETRRGLLGPHHPDVVDSLNSLGALLMARGQTAEAGAVFEELLPLARSVYGETHPIVARTLHNLGSVRRDQGDLEAAEAYYLQALEMNRATSGPAHAIVGIVLYNLANVSLDRGRPAEAEERLREAIGILAAALPPDHWRLATARSRLGESLTVQGRFAEAEPLLLESWPLIRDARGAAASGSRDALRRIVELYEKWGRAEDAGRWAAQGAEPTAAPPE